jgi:hypothetical protein
LRKNFLQRFCQQMVAKALTLWCHPIAGADARVGRKKGFTQMHAEHADGGVRIAGGSARLISGGAALVRDRESGLAQFKRQCILVHLFQ